MYKNYFFLLKCINQLENIIVGREIIDAYTQEKDKLFLHIPMPDKPNFHLIISTNLQHPFINAKEEHFKAKKNTIHFFNDYFPSEIKSISIALGDRVVKIILNTGSLTILFKGGDSNVIFTDDKNVLHTFKKISLDEKTVLSEELKEHNFINFLVPILSLIEDTGDAELIRKMPFIGKEILKEVEFRGLDFKNNILDVLNEIIDKEISVYFDDYLGRPSFHPVSFKSRIIPEEHFTYGSYFNALNKYFALFFSQSQIKNVRREIEKFLTKEIEVLSSKINSLKGRVESGTKENEYHQCGSLLLANIGSIKKGMKDIELNDYHSGCMHKIKLDEKLSANQNIERFFDKARSEKIEFQKSNDLLLSSVKEFERLIRIRDKFECTEDQVELLKIKKKLKMRPQQLQSEDAASRISFRHFLIESKYHVYVGKDSKNNDLLTTKFAKQNDFWFHARSVSGSHVVLRVDNSKETIPKNILQKSASIAAFYSKAKTSKLVPVTYTFKKYVTKNARHEVGQVTVTKETVLLVKPEIPKDCEMITD